MIRNIFLVVVLIVGTPTLLFSQERASARPDGNNKIAPSLDQGKIEFVRVLVKNKDTFHQWMKLHFPETKVEEENLPGIYRISLSKRSDIEKLAQSAAIEFIDRGNRMPNEEKALGAFDLTLNKIFAAQNLFGLTGAGLAASIKEKPFDAQDIDLKNRVIFNEQFDEAPTLHATSMATIISGAGNSEPSGRGIAPGAEVTTSDFLQLLPDEKSYLMSLGVSVQNHSYGVGVENYYGIESAAYDDHCKDFPAIVHVFSSGNDGDKIGTGQYVDIAGFANLTGQFKVSKNTLSVGSVDAIGNVASRSSRGPAHDGRVKPELVAFGDAGSSEAAAVVSGISLLVQQKYVNQVGALPPSSLVKAVLINSADDIGQSNVDFETGFGNADAVGAIRTIDQNHFFLGNISGGVETVYNINVPEHSHTLKVTLVWNDLAASPNATTALVNDLDLEVRHVASGNRWKPWVLSHYAHRDSLLALAKRKADHLNNVEQVTIDLPVPGLYELIVKGFSIPQGTETFSIAYETESGFAWTNPTVGNSFTANRNNFVRWRWSEAPATGKLEYKSVGKTMWIEIAGNIDLTSQYYPWVTPDSTLRVQLRIIVDNTIYESEIFTIVKPIALKVGYNCDNETMLTWSDVEEANQYQLYRMGDQYLEPFLLTTDTFAVLDAQAKEVLEYTVSPVINGMTGQKGNTIDYTNTGTDCYFINFLPRQYVVTDEATFDLTVGTTYKLNSVILERLSNEVTTEIQNITPISTAIVLRDTDPEPGVNRYRVRLENENHEALYVSGFEEIVYVRSTDLFVYPNPIAAGELLNVIADDLGTVRLRVFDAIGRLMKESTDPGTIKTIDTTSLVKGAYIIELLKNDGNRLTARLMVY